MTNGVYIHYPLISLKYPCFQNKKARGLNEPRAFINYLIFFTLVHSIAPYF